MRTNTWSYQSIPATDKTGIPDEDDKVYFTNLLERERMLKRIREAKLRRMEAHLWLKDNIGQIKVEIPTTKKAPFSLREFIKSNLP